MSRKARTSGEPLQTVANAKAKAPKKPKASSKATGKPQTARKAKGNGKTPPKAKAAPKATQKAPAHTLATNEGMRAESVTDTPGRGRPTAYTPEAADEIIKRMHCGETLREICRSEHLPHESTVRLWNMDDREGFSTRYATARSALIDFWQDDLVTIGDDGRNDWMERRGAEGELIGVVINGEHVSRSKLRCENRKWLLSKLRPEQYGDRSTVQHGLTNEFAAFLGQIDGFGASLV